VSARKLGRLLLLPVWVLALGLLALAAAHLVAFDDRRVFLLADAYALWLLLPAYAVLIAALCFKARALALVALVVVVAHLAWVLPPVFRTVDVPAAAATSPRLRVVSANVMFDNPHHRTLLHELASYHADVLVLEEITPDWWASIRRSGLLASHRHVVAAPRWGAAGLVIISRLPLRDRRLRDAQGWPIPSATVRIGDRDLHLVGVHVIAPLETFGQNQQQQSVITGIIRRTPAPRIVAGDFNATPTNRWYGQIRDLGLREVHEAVGEPFATTWPNGQHLLPPLQLDHSFVDDPPVVPLRVRQGVGSGSDHRPVIVDYAVLPR
jgi:endonuclease/exonuclease/phosphatase (EEP) superfamily protein YafD